MAKNDGGTAFPMQDGTAIHAYAFAASHRIKDHEERETAYISALASDADFPHRENVAGRAYAYADAMLDARNQTKDPSP